MSIISMGCGGRNSGRSYFEQCDIADGIPAASVQRVKNGLKLELLKLSN